jgi:catechol 2,3-dioxygenase-like lactoylglutathione lyase family enzyme
VGNLLAFGSIVKLHGIHHITAIASDPQRNVDFYTQILGLPRAATPAADTR